MAGISKSQKLELSNIAVELDKEEVRLIRYVLESYFTMTSVARLVNTLKACKYAVENNVPGDFVECGVWRGGHGILAKKILGAKGPKNPFQGGRARMAEAGATKSTDQNFEVTQIATKF